MNGSTTVDALVIGGGATGAGLLRDLSRRGLKTLLVEKSDLGTGTSGRYHGLLHSGGRYVVTDPAAAHECAVENAIVRRIAPACVEDTGGYFVATPEDPDDFGDGFAAACAASSVPVDEVFNAASSVNLVEFFGRTYTFTGNPAYARCDSSTAPRVRRSVKSSARERAASSSVVLPAPGSPSRSSAPHVPAAASASILGRWLIRASSAVNNTNCWT